MKTAQLLSFVQSESVLVRFPAGTSASTAIVALDDDDDEGDGEDEEDDSRCY